jgi:hypothetical protein
MEYNEMAEYASKIPHHQPTFMISMVQHYEFKVYGKFTVSSNESAIINNSNTSTTNTNNNTNNTNTNNNSNNSNSNGNGKESNVNIVGGGVVLENRVKVIVEEYKDKQIVVI